ncbi:hypothetical protein [Microbacterium thalassium]|uniref:Uncharacterized protein n=1 Tax=Microbacterium thalassium TaxID=362649 RepID=A0A7X0FNV2_9MICO|nr:hypothetical protein [Microbacterium thalassium]MBB6390475.1 hypothetical protein [Microbacterium thalassium]GLK25585.1 hypothetical protein GCM10017607_29040 [Microbacterium thalassium]
MFILYAVLFIAGLYLFGLAFNLAEYNALVFFAGILCISLAMALPFHFTRHE